ncbi:uncharacterized protein LOC123265402 [Cotesia glomerata]|uniref:uncharacterized protein LOC123265402 n=1 Tax=Cotesia glomerata TaxID=32391 RepID=UPI001D028DBB|nr:uncharacterized protein LOC123265402 [Cotesia glomerata]
MVHVPDDSGPGYYMPHHPIIKHPALPLRYALYLMLQLKPIKLQKILKRDLYVDNLLTGSNSLTEILKLRDEIIQLVRKGGFELRQWASNHRHALDNFDQRTLDLDCAINDDPISKTLGIAWNSLTDEFIYTVKSNDSSRKITKRTILSDIAKIFDPIGILGPIVLAAKTIIQECWKLKVHWDETVPQELHLRWCKFAEQLPLIKDFSVERNILIPDPTDIQLHGFCDASRVGYGACIYIRSVNKHGDVIVKLVCSKSRVAPIKDVTIPKLELCGALLLAKLYKDTIPSFNFDISKVTFWSDSTIVLQWLKRSPSTLKVFEANRVTQIQTLCSKIEWRHVRTKDNPADCLSRGQLPSEFLNNKMWLIGPTWLSQDPLNWPNLKPTVLSELPGIIHSNTNL